MTAVTASLGGTSGVRVPFLSLHGFYIALSFTIFTVLMRFALPFGDEPDFTVRAVALTEGGMLPPWTPYFWMEGLLNEFPVESSCKIAASTQSVWGHIDSATCLEPLKQIIIRVVVTLLCCAPLLWAVVNRRALHQLLRMLGLRLEFKELNERLDSLGTALLIPGMVYYLGLLSHEQFTLVISLLISVVWGSWWLILGLALYTTVVDLGNGVIVLTFLALYLVILWIWRLFGYPGVGVFLIGLASGALWGGYMLLNYVQIVPLLMSKATAIYEKSLTADFLTKYPAILRPGISYLTAVFMTPSGIKAVPVQVMFALVIVVGLRRLRTGRQWDRTLAPDGKNMLSQSCMTDASRLLPTIAALATVLAFSLTLPDYANAKYYMFLTPFFMRPFVAVFNRQSRLLFMIYCFILTLILLALQYF